MVFRQLVLLAYCGGQSVSCGTDILSDMTAYTLKHFIVLRIDVNFKKLLCYDVCFDKSDFIYTS